MTKKTDGAAWPDATIQSVLNEAWWEQTKTRDRCLGRLGWAYVANATLIPMHLVVQGRASATDHNTARFQLTELRAGSRIDPAELPVAALSLKAGEVAMCQRGKRRPVLVLGDVGVPQKAPPGAAKHPYQRSCLVAPYYGVGANGQRAGWNDVHVRAIQTGRLPQYLWDRLPESREESGSVLRLDRLHALGSHHDAVDCTTWKLSTPALDVVRDQLEWLIWGDLRDDSSLAVARELLAEFV